MLLGQRPELSFRIPRLAAPPKECSRAATVAGPIVACMVEARRPTQREIALVAARIWKDWSGRSAASWKDVAPDSAPYRRMMAAARFALGDSAIGSPPAERSPGEPIIWWKADRHQADQ